MFTAGEGNVLVGSDFSQQEPRLLSEYSGDEKMIGAYREGKDLYATIGTGVYHNNYWDNMEHHEDGSPNPEGKARRKKMKILLLGRCKHYAQVKRCERTEFGVTRLCC